MITNAMNATVKNSVAVLEEFLQQKYVEVYDKDTSNSEFSKIELLQKYYKEYFYIPKEENVGNLNYVVNSDGKALYLIKKSGLPKDIQEMIKGGSDEGKTYTDFQSLNDVYGVTKDLKVYYSSGPEAQIFALSKDLELDDDNLQRKVFDSNNGYYSTLSSYDIDGNGEVSVEELKSVVSLTIDSTSNINSLSDLYNLVSLKKLIIDGKSLSSLDGIQNCPSLFYVYFKNVHISDYSNLSSLGSKLQYLYFYDIDDDELKTVCDGIKDAQFNNLEYFAVGGYNEWYEVNSDLYAISYNNVNSSKSNRTITSLKPLESLSDVTKKAIRYMCINNNNITDDNLMAISDFTNLYLLRMEYNSVKSLYGLENMKNLTYLYACNNLLGQDCLEDGEDKTKNCLSSLENKNKSNAVQKDGSTDGLFYLNLRDNKNLKCVDYLENDVDVRYLYLRGCNSGMNVNSISDIILSCGNNYDLPCKFLTGTTYTWSDYYYNGNKVEGKEELTANKLKQDLENNSTITCLNLSGCRRNKNDGDEITDEVLNEILKTMSQLQYVRLDSTNLKTLGFCGIKDGTSNKNDDLENLSLYAYCPNLIELDLRNTYVTDISNLNNVIKKTTQNPDGRDMGTLRVSKSLEIDDKTKTNKLVNLSEIQDVINGLTGERYYYTNMGCHGFVASDFETMDLLSNCTNICSLNSLMWSVDLHEKEKELDLSKLNKLTKMNIAGWDFKIKFPSKLNYFAGDQVRPPVFSDGSSFDYILLKVSDSHIDDVGCEEARNFFKSLENCASINRLYFKNCDFISEDVFYDEEGEKEIFTGKSINLFNLYLGTSEMYSVIEHLSGLVELVLTFGAPSSNGMIINASLSGLKSLFVTGQYFSDFSIFNSLGSLTTLTISNCENFKTLSGLEDLTSLTKLVVNNTGISSVVPLKNMVSLIHVDLKNNAIMPYSDSDGKSVSNLDILASLHPDEGIGKLKTLYLQGNDGLNGVIESHPISSLSWSNGNIWK